MRNGESNLMRLSLPELKILVTDVHLALQMNDFKKYDNAFILLCLNQLKSI